MNGLCVYKYTKFSFVWLTEGNTMLFSCILTSMWHVYSGQQKEFLFIPQISQFIIYASLYGIWHRQACSLTVKNFPKDLCHYRRPQARELIIDFHLLSWITAQLPILSPVLSLDDSSKSKAVLYGRDGTRINHRQFGVPIMVILNILTTSIRDEIVILWKATKMVLGTYAEVTLTSR